jgi:hypothetical protein
MAIRRTSHTHTHAAASPALSTVMRSAHAQPSLARPTPMRGQHQERHAPPKTLSTDRVAPCCAHGAAGWVHSTRVCMYLHHHHRPHDTCGHIRRVGKGARRSVHTQQQRQHKQYEIAGRTRCTRRWSTAKRGGGGGWEHTEKPRGGEKVFLPVCRVLGFRAAKYNHRAQLTDLI